MDYSLIAIMLGRLGMSAEEALTAYENLSLDIFGDRRSRLRDGMYSAEKFIKIIQSVVKQKLGQENVTMRAGGESKCKMYGFDFQSFPSSE